ncbi:MAG: MarR family transcriptional regulator [Ruminococcaceae bacterium]|nr:MarR family transcriptional regulator [Oscillospiraceae bacterium]
MNRTAEEALRLDNQLCFPLYAASREVVKQYHPLLASLNLTYTQYLVMLVLWEKAPVSEKEMGVRLHLDSGTLTPVLKSLEAKGYILRTRSKEDERVVCVLLTDAGAALKNNAGDVPGQISASIPLTEEEAATLHELLYKILNNPEK